jgi:hypothetical protein
VFYQKGHCEGISTCNIERVIGRYRLYPDKKKQEKTARKRARASRKLKKKISQ